MGYVLVFYGSVEADNSWLDRLQGDVVFFRIFMSLYNRLIEEKDRLGKKSLRFPKTRQELLDRKRRERIYSILTRRYEYGIEDAMDNYRRQDQIDEVDLQEGYARVSEKWVN